MYTIKNQLQFRFNFNGVRGRSTWARNRSAKTCWTSFEPRETRSFGGGGGSGAGTTRGIRPPRQSSNSSGVICKNNTVFFFSERPH